MKHYLFYLIAAAISVCSCEPKKTAMDYVNPNIGGISHLLVPAYPTVYLPNSMIRVHAMRDGGYNQDRIKGFPLSLATHRLGYVFNLLPYSKGEGVTENRIGEYRFDHEKTTPYNYSVWLDDYDITVGFAPTERCGIYTLDYRSTKENHLQLLTIGGGELKIEGSRIEGYDLFSNAKVYMYGEVSQQPSKIVASADQTSLNNGKLTTRKGEGIDLTFDSVGTEPIQFRYALSYISIDQAKKNLEKELTTWDELAVANEGKRRWNEALGKIEIEGDEDTKTVFYSSLYRSYERPININEYGQYYSGYDKQIHSTDRGFYVDDWCWDTYIAHHPLHSIINPRMQEDRAWSYVTQYEQSGLIPTYPLFYGDVHYINGLHPSSVIWDAWSKGLRNFDLRKAFEGCKHTIHSLTMLSWVFAPACELDSFYLEKGWYPSLKSGEKEYIPIVHPFENRQAVSIALETSFDFWSMAQMAKELGLEEDYQYYIKRSFNYRNHFHPETTFFQPKDIDGNWVEPYDPIFSGGIGCREFFGELNAWTYNWRVQHNIADLIQLFGSKDRFEQKLDQLFVEDLKIPRWQYYGRMPDATGNVGQFVMGNEPSFHIPYLYNYIGAPWKTQKRIRSLMNMWFRNDQMGLSGDEDGGGMTAFYVFSAMGFYPVTPGLPMYVIGSPAVDYAKIDVGEGRYFEVIAKNNSKENKYIRSVKLNGKEWNKSWFPHSELIKGGTLEFEMDRYPNTKWATDAESIPPSFTMN